ncbi:hypothetical protein [Methanosarcina siciliae]|uniref:hypothetical protein n=1 Tax=Methanosarcina siciliae TaxID=38027 RepID=UPI000B06BCEB|nr:hypothetical protein [Methanosarcina siciliae]
MDISIRLEEEKDFKSVEYMTREAFWEKKNKKIVLLEGYYAPEIYVMNKDTER